MSRIVPGRVNLLHAAQSALWAIVPSKLDEVFEFLALRASGHTLSKRELASRGFSTVAARPGTLAIAKASAVEEQKLIALLPLHGVIAHHAGFEMQISGGTSTEAFGQAFDAAIANPAISAIVIDCDSPGGTVEGVAELFDKVYKARGTKPVKAVVNAHMHSAAYWICSAADEIIATPSAQVGNIGVMTMRVDTSERMAKEGIKHTIIKAGKYKGEGASFEPMTDEEYEARLELAETMYGMFTSAVAKGRGDSVENVKNGYGEGRSVLAKQAKKIGLIDRIATLESVLAEFGASAPKKPAARSMTALAALNAQTCPDCGHEYEDGTDVCPECDDGDTEEISPAAAMAAVALVALPELQSAVTAEITPSTLTASAGRPAAPIAVEPQDTQSKTSQESITMTEQEKADALKALRAAESERVESIRALCTDHGMTLNADKYIKDGLSVDQVRAAILDEKKTVTQATRVPLKTTVVEKVQARFEEDPARGYSAPTEFMLAVMNNSDASDKSDIDDERLRSLATRTDKGDKVIGSNLMAFVMPNAFVPARFHATVGSDEQGNYSNRYGGFLKPEQVVPGLLQTSFEGDPTDGRTQAVPMSAPTVKFNARTDKDHSTSVSGGFTFTRRPETVAATASRGEFEQVVLQASTLTGLAYATDEIMADSPISFAQIIADGFSQQLGFHLFSEKMRGGNAGEFLGVLNTNNAALITVSKESNQTADTIVTQNLSKMVARCWGYDDAIWLANHTTIPTLTTLSVGVGTAGALVWMTDMTKGYPATLFGRPIFFTELCSAVGDLNDIVLLNMSQYLEGTYQPVQTASSVHVRWVNSETAFKTWLRNAAAPWWRTALTPKYGDTRSPFINLQAR